MPRKTASGPMPISGMKLMQIIMLEPISRLPQSASGTTKSSRTTASTTRSGAASIQAILRPVEAPGTDSARISAKALAASTSVNTNFDMKRIVCMAGMMSGRGPMVAKKTTAAIATATPTASHQALPSGIALSRASASSALMRSSVLMSLSSKPFGDRGETAMQRHAHRRLADPELARRLADRMAVDRDRRHHRALRRRQPVERPVDVALTHRFRLRFREGFGDLIDLDLDTPSAPAESVDQLEAGNCVDPRQDRRILAPGVSFDVNCQQGFLHDILGVDPALYDLAPDKAANESGNPVQKVGIRPFIARDRSPEQPGELGLVLAGHRVHSPDFRASALVCYVAGEIMSKPNCRKITKVCGAATD
ncbi:hypothetical protein MPL3365_10254 [Mesorhizobium plurifarium]|uniref:Uncharacterized protein n=1 Tax=Mesorhizobium plurifarium TaxID=69974 RepID=A0A090G0F0_MESPL|nr:hypothetical protein MPL3365_10254 [Mesorhizobium plurifarium]